MTPMHRKSIIAAAIAALVSAPAWAAGTTSSPSTTPSTQPSATMNESTTSSSQLMSMTPNDLEGKKVVDSAGHEVGKVKDVVASRTQKDAYAVIKVGGLRGKRIAVPLNELALSGDQLRIDTTMAQLEQRPEYQKEQYVKVKPDSKPISEFSAFESGTPSTPKHGTSGSTMNPSRSQQPSPSRY